MRVAVFSAKRYDRELLDAVNRECDHELVYFDSRLEPDTVALASGFPAVCVFARIMRGFGCHVLGCGKVRSAEFEALGGRSVEPPELGERADIVSLHLPLTPETHYVIDGAWLARLKHGALLVNTSRGGLIDTEAAIDALKRGQLGGLAIDVYEQEEELFFQDLSNSIITDDVIQRLVSFPNVIFTGHQAFFTREAVGTISATTLASITDSERGQPLANEVRGDLA